jgi:trans-aconitate methyltransferase
MMTAAAVPAAADVYALGSNPDESARLRRQSEELRPESVALLDRIALEPGHSAIDLGCGPSGIFDLLSAAVSADGRVVGVDADSAHVALARQYASARPGQCRGHTS